MKKLLCAIVCLLSAVPQHGAYIVRISDLQYSPLPPNPVKVYGWVASQSPLTMTDGRAAVTVTGVTGQLGDLMVLEGDYADGVLAVTQAPGKAVIYALPSMTEMVHVPAGAFLMGNSGVGNDAVFPYEHEFPQHPVALSSFWVGRCDLTRAEYARFIAAGGYGAPEYWSAEGWDWKVSNGRTEPLYWAAEQDWGSGAFHQTDEHPVAGVSYFEAEAFCAWAGGRLPTEAEWEKAARWAANSPLVYPWGNWWGADNCNNYYDINPAAGGYQAHQTAPAGSYGAYPGPYGSLDTSGNVYEWCSDWYGAVYYAASPAVDPQGPDTGSYRILRGGSWYHSACFMRCSSRSGDVPSSTWYGLGFRMAR